MAGARQIIHRLSPLDPANRLAIQSNTKSLHIKQNMNVAKAKADPPTMSHSAQKEADKAGDPAPAGQQLSRRF